MAAAKKAASAELWRRGDIRGFLLDPVQQGILREIDASTHVQHVVLSSRRLGKSYTLVSLAIETAIKSKHQYIKYLTTTSKAAKEIVMPLFRQILSTCPEELRPEYRVHDSKFLFPNGSEILLHGCDDGGDSLRGQSADLAIIDEAGFVSKLDTLVSDVLTPMVVERNGRIVLSSTPPRDSTHAFLSFIARAEKNKTLTKRTIYDCPRFTEKQIRTFEEEAGGRDSDTFRIEYMCEIVLSGIDRIVPEFDDKTMAEIVYSQEPTLNYIPDRYVALDPGFSDNAAILFGYYDFVNAMPVIQAEYVAKGNNTAQLSEAITTNEKALWGGLQPLKRVSDTDLRLIKDLKDLHGIKFSKTPKDNKEAQINELRILVKQKRIRIHESCTNLIMQLKYGQWKTSSSGNRDFKRTAELGHNDAIDALIYFIRNLSKHRNPVPEAVGDPHSYWYQPTRGRVSGLAKKLSRAFV